MFSKVCELTGLGLIAWGLVILLGEAAGIIFAGVSLVFVGIMTNDDAVGLVIRRGWGWLGYLWHRQLLKENGHRVPPLRPKKVADGLLECDCGGEFDCTICDGLGFYPDPAYQDNNHSPHPEIKDDPIARQRSVQMARQRIARAELDARER